jgi:transcriptional regulator with XRE-family HTH domain
MKSPKAADVYVGQRIRQRRVMINKSQEALAEKTGITFQQIQKYEKGTNRVSASRLVEFSKHLSVPVEWFFEGLPGYDPEAATVPAALSNFVSSQEGLRTANAFETISDPKLLMSFIRLIEAVADSDGILTSRSGTRAARKARAHPVSRSAR